MSKNLNKNIIKKYWLALWWWAARGFAHIWLIKYLEEKNIEINEVSGTSMWAIIASCFAIWMNSSEMEKVVSDINYFNSLITIFRDIFESSVTKNFIFNNS